MSDLKVLFLTRWYPSRNDPLDGNFIENHVRAVALYCDVAVLYVGADPKMNQSVYHEVQKENGVVVVRVWYRNNDVPRKGIGRVIKFFRYLRCTYVGWQLIRTHWGWPDVSHVNIFTRPSLLALYLDFVHGIPFLLTEHSSHFVYELPTWLPPKKQFARFVARRARYITVVSHALKKAITDFGIRGRYAIVPNVVFIPTEEPKTCFYPLRIVAIGGLSDERKNVKQLIEVFARVHPQLNAAQLHIISPIPNDLLHRTAAATGLLDRAIFFHYNLPNDQVYEMLQSSALLVVNSLSETFSMAAAEALACGLPVIATRCGGPEEFIDETRGMLIAPAQPDELADALRTMIRNLPRYDARRIKEFVRAHFSPEVVGALLMQLYHDTLKSSRHRSRLIPESRSSKSISAL